ncbi:hypothetical protein ACFX15_024595 [Malus domestica]
MVATMATASTVMGLGNSSLLPSRISLFSGFVKPIVVDDPLRQVKASGGRFTCSFQKYWLRRDLNRRENEFGMMGSRGSIEDDGGDGKGSTFGLGAGCDLGLDIGLLSYAGFGPGIPGLQVGLSLGVGFGVGLRFGVAIQKEREKKAKKVRSCSADREVIDVP